MHLHKSVQVDVQLRFSTLEVSVQTDLTCSNAAVLAAFNFFIESTQNSDHCSSPAENVHETYDEIVGSSFKRKLLSNSVINRSKKFKATSLHGCNKSKTVSSYSVNKRKPSRNHNNAGSQHNSFKAAHKKGLHEDLVEDSDVKELLERGKEKSALRSLNNLNKFYQPRVNLLKLSTSHQHKVKIKQLTRKVGCKKNLLTSGISSNGLKQYQRSCHDEDGGGCNGGSHQLIPVPVHHHEKKFLREQTDLKLPSIKKVKSSDHPSLNFKKIRNNIYVDVKPVSNGFEAHACNCKPPLQSDQMGCSDDDCLNRMIYTECNANLCQCRDRCGNQRIQKHQDFRHLKKFLTKECGFGVKATKPLKAGQFIIEYVGEVMSELEFRRRMSTLYSHMQHHYCLSLEGGVVIDGYKSGNISRLINHSCSPNCQMQKWNVNGVYRIGLFALKDVEPNEELTYDYNFHAYNVNTQQACKCGSSNCRLVVGGRSQKDSSSNRKGSYCFTMHLTSNDRLNWLNKSSAPPSSILELTVRERKVAKRKVIFLLRNLEKMKKKMMLTNESNDVCSGGGCMRGGGAGIKDGADDDEKKREQMTEIFKTQFEAISTNRSVRTRKLSKAEDDADVCRMSDLAQVFMQVFNSVSSTTNVRGEKVVKLFSHLFTKKRACDSNEISPQIIERNIKLGKYCTSVSFHDDFNKLFNYLSSCEQCHAGGTTRENLEVLKRGYRESMLMFLSFLESLGDQLPTEFQQQQQQQHLQQQHLQPQHLQCQQQHCFSQHFIDVDENAVVYNGTSSGTTLYNNVGEEVENDVNINIHDGDYGHKKSSSTNIYNLYDSFYVPSIRNKELMRYDNSYNAINSNHINNGCNDSYINDSTVHPSQQQLQDREEQQSTNNDNNITKLIFDEDAHDEDDGIIRCVCGLFEDVGLMFQCDLCKTWQHKHCMNAGEVVDEYLCHICSGSKFISMDIPLPEQPRKDPATACVYYLSLMKYDATDYSWTHANCNNMSNNRSSNGKILQRNVANVQLHVGDTVYIVDDEYTPDSSPLPAKDKLDLFKIENLWIDENNERQMFGHYFLRPSEVFRDAGQKFFEREVLKATTLSCCVQLDRVVARCIVMDVNSYLLGRPTGFDEEDVYVCEFRVNKAFRTQKKPLKFVNPVNKSSYCFQYFKKDAVTFKRNYMPNGTISSGEHRHHYKRGRSQRNSKLKNATAQVLGHLDESHSNEEECVGDNSNVERPGDNEDESGKKHVSKNVIQTRKVEEKKANLEDLIKKLKYS